MSVERLEIPGLDVSRETEEKLRDFAGMVSRWTSTINLISPKTTPEIWQRHVRDSAQIVVVPRAAPNMWLDLGSGGGFPGVVLSVIAAELWPRMMTVLVESDQRKATFLRAAIRELSLNATVLDRRSEELASIGADVMTARAFAPLVALLGHARHHLAPNGQAVLHKGQNYENEIARARQQWRFDLAIRPSLTDEKARILTVERIERV